MTAPDSFGQVLGHHFADRNLLLRALTHKSFGAETSNERLEFLGDRVLGMVVAETLYAAHPTWDEGALAVRLNGLVRRETLAQIAGDIGLGRFLRLAKGEEEQGGRAKPAILADAMEAVIAAVFLDGGLPAARGVVARLWVDYFANRVSPPKDAKTALQEWTVAQGLGQPRYETVDRSGPDHAPVFIVAVILPGGETATGEGTSKRNAEQEAAKALITALKAEP
ncbi:ribonuclease III [Zavarzinia compransoris]|uniref:ribonuclease III n=1 Tax=Zavarzinia compransoris TaxID=1264899 RepID=UPI0010E6A573|nr:ribonuclease III [Zavarzinia compransoris]TDP47798.1 RNAse III [Zavarzinia compransoris]